jgi:hypothetical protein
VQLTRSAITRSPARKALLVGINDYPDPQNRLEGCVNDVFRMSEVLQEMGFDPSEIRVVLNERATAQGIKERLKWLLADTGKDDVRFFFYSGHGAQIPAPTDSSEVDGNEETLVPYDFDWTAEHAFTDKEFVEMYSQLNYDTKFICMFDCCHSGGVTRDGSHRARGINPPDDIRHRKIKWDKNLQMWVDRDIPLSNADIFSAKTKNKEQFTGMDRSTFKLGRSVPLWTSDKQFETNKKVYGHNGPYVPTVLSACREDQLAYEYRHGVTSFGAFTFSITTILREIMNRNRKPSFEQLMQMTEERLKWLRYDQRPVLFPESRKGHKTYLL